MSAKLMGAVFDLVLDRDEFPVMIALADHAHDDGTSVHPSVGYLAWKTNMSERSVQRVLRKLEARGLIEAVSEGSSVGRGHTREYVIHIEKGDKKSPFNGRKPAQKGDSTSPISSEKGDNVTPLRTEKGDKPRTERVTNPTGKGDTAMAPQPSVEPSVEPVHVEDVRSSRPQRERSYVRKSDIRDQLYNAVIGCWRPGKTWRDLTKSEQSLVGKTASELIEVGACPEDVPRAWANWKRLYPRWGNCTPAALTKHWGSLTAADDADEYDESRYEKRIASDGSAYYIQR